jgi:ribose transport system permease protein
MSTSETAGGGFDLKRVFFDQLRTIAPLLTLLALVIFFSATTSTFATLDNAVNIIRQMSITGIIAVGLTYVILTAEIDLSVAAVANAIGITVAYFTVQPDYVNIPNIPLNGAIAIVLTILSAVAFGLLTAFGMTYVGIPSFIMTLAVMQIANGVSALLVRGQIAYQYPDLVTTLGSKTAFQIPLGVDAAGKALFIPIGWTIVVCFLFFLVGHLVLKYTRFGRYVYMVGGNREAAEYSGVNVKLIIAAVMVICAFCSGVAGMLGVAYFGSAQQNQFDTFLLDAIAAVVVGGTSLFGGRGGIGNTIVGLLVLGVVNNGLDHIQMDSFQKILIRGLILLAALVINVYVEKFRERASDQA